MKNKSDNNNPPRLLLDFPNTAAALDISVSHLHNLDNSGKIIAPMKLGSRRLFSLKSLDKWIDAGCLDRISMSLKETAK